MKSSLSFFYFIVLALLAGACSRDEQVKPSTATDIPHVYITTVNGQAVVSKDEYIAGEMKIMEGSYVSYNGAMKVKVRGNTTATFPKKPYHIKLDESSLMLGLAKNRDWILLANFLDETLLTNAVAFKTGDLLGMPFTNHIIAVDVTVNGTYQGSYNLTEQIETGKNRVDVENGGQLLELDQYFDEPWEFRSTQFDLPVMVHYPQLTLQSELDSIQQGFESLTSLVMDSSFPNNNYLDYLDEESVINYFIVMLITDNEELNHPKSTYIYKTAGGKYHLGPIWDFDWAYGFEGNYTHIVNYSHPLFWAPVQNFSGTSFFYSFLRNPQTKTKLQQKWDSFKNDKLPLLIQYVNDYSSTIAASYKRDYALWASQQANRLTEVDAKKMQDWLNNRATFIDAYLPNLP